MNTSDNTQAIPGEAFNFFKEAVLYYQQQQFDKALQRFNHVLTLAPNFAPAFRYLADIYLLQQEYILAEKYYQEIIHLQTEDADVFSNLGVVYLKQDQWEKACHYFCKAIVANENHVEARNNLAAVYLQHERYDNAMRQYQVLVNIRPNDIEVHYNLAVAAMAVGELALAKQHFEKTLELDRNHSDAMINLAAVHLKLNATKAAIHLYETVLKIQPEQPIARYMLQALQGQQTSRHAPRYYIENLFDNYSGYYDKHMQEVLHYQLPKLMVELLNPYLKPKMTILDLGCGSGLMGDVLQPFEPVMTGIDLSNKMLTLAKRKNYYKQLIHADLITGMQALTTSFDLIIAADVFVYIGDLNLVFTEVKKLLKPKGLFCFSTEVTDIGYKLLTSARYAHAVSYIQELVLKNNFEMIIEKEIIPRYQEEQPVRGRIYILSSK